MGVDTLVEKKWLAESMFSNVPEQVDLVLFPS